MLKEENIVVMFEEVRSKLVFGVEGSDDRSILQAKEMGGFSCFTSSMLRSLPLRGVHFL